MLIRALLLFTFLIGCKGGTSKPLPEALLGEWEVLCRTDKESTSTCLGKEDHGLYKTFHAGGKLISGARQGSEMEGTWELSGDSLVLKFAGGGLAMSETYRARIEDGKLILWYVSGEFGSVLGRLGAPFKAAASKTVSAGPMKHTIGGVSYSIVLPTGYRLARDDNNRQVWAPSAGEGLTVRLSVSPRSQTEVDGNWITPPCNEYDYGGISGSSETIDGVERETSVGKSLCLKDSDKVLMCSGEHSRGYLEASEMDAALGLCESLVAK